jgi:uridine kinase
MVPLTRLRRVQGFESISTWRQPLPAPASVARTELINEVAQQIVDIGPGRIRVAIDGFTAAGKTSFGHEIAASVRARGRPTLRASLDDFKKPWRDAADGKYDRLSGEGYYRNAPDFNAAREFLLKPAAADGSGKVVLCAHDPLTGADHRDVTVQAPPNAVLIVDSVFAFRPEYNDFWDLRIWLDVDESTSAERSVTRDGDRDGHDLTAERHKTRYQAAELIYVAEIDPRSVADLVIDNNNITEPRFLRHG